MKPIFELCAASYEDCMNAFHHGADRIELNSALSAGGLTPSLVLLKKVKKDCGLPVICMVRPREAGFCYNKSEAELMMEEAAMLLDAGADGIAFGFLKADGTIDPLRTRQMVELIHSYPGRTAVFHRAFDVTPDPFAAAKTLIDLHVDRILTSGQKAAALEGASLLAALNERFGKEIEILPGAGINAENAVSLLAAAGLDQVHASCKTQQTDPTTHRGDVSYTILPDPNEDDYLCADPQKIAAMRQALDAMDQQQD